MLKILNIIHELIQYMDTIQLIAIGMVNDGYLYTTKKVSGYYIIICNS